MAFFSSMKLQNLVSWMVLMAMLAPNTRAKCAFEAIFNFGDSQSDTGGFYAAFPPQSQSLPNGMTFFGKPTGRTSDGRLYIDFLAQALGLPFLSPYLQSIGSDFRHGVNFATSASPVIQPNSSLFVTGVSPFYLAVQINQMKQFKAKVEELKSQEHTNLPKPDIFGKALYTIHIGQHDIAYDVADFGAEGTKRFDPQIAREIANAIEELYRLGGRTFFVQNLAPIGCYADALVQVKHKSSDIDKAGCLIFMNNAVRDYNSVLKGELQRTRQRLKDANVIYVDMYPVIDDLYRNPSSHGYKHGITPCCGYGGGVYNFDPRVFCGTTTVINGKKVTATACRDPHNYVSWDGIHLTEKGNKIVADAILKGAYFDPPFNLSHYCDIQPIG